MNIIDQYKESKKKAFTLVEVMLLLVVLSLIMASSVSVITRKHKLKPRRAVHGQYICFYEQYKDASTGNMVNQGKHEIMISGKSTVRDVISNDASFECSFKIPSAASYIHVRMLGGGGAGGNANYSPNNSPVEEVKNINLVRSYPETVTSSNNYYVHPKITGSTETDDSSNSYTYASSSTSMGISPDYVNGKFNKGTTSAENEAIFTSTLFKYLIKNYIIGDGVFAYDYAGDGESGGGVNFNYFDYSTMQCPGGGVNFKQCYQYWIQGPPYTDIKGNTLQAKTLANQSNTCVTYATNASGATPSSETFKTYCPQFFKDFYTPSSVVSSQQCSGSNGGKGTVFATAPREYDFYTFPVLGWRWSNYNSTENLMKSRGDLCNLFQTYKNQTPIPIIDWLQCSFYDSSSNLTPEYKDAAVTAGVLEPCPTGAAANECVTVNANSYKATNGNIYSSGNVIPGKVPNLSPLGSFDTTQVSFPTVKKYEETIHDGALPYYKGVPNSGSYGVKLHYSTSGITQGSGNANGIIKTTGSILYGKAGVTLDDFSSLWNDDGSKKGCPAVGTAGSDGGSYFDPDRSLVCIANLGFDLKKNIGSLAITKEDMIGQVLYADSSAFTCYDTHPQTSHNPNQSLSISEDQMALQLTLHYYNKAISYGAPGKAGGYKEFFTRSNNSNTIYVKPGLGGVSKALPSETELANITVYANEKPGADQNGGKTLIYYNCNAAKTECAMREVAGGAGGGGGLWEAPESLKYTGKEINDTITAINAGNKNIKCSYSAPALNGCTVVPGYEDIFKGEASKFVEVAPLLDLPLSSTNVNLEELGSGGDGGWVVDNCWYLPQYFTIRGGSYLGFEDDILTNITSLGAPNYYGYTNFSESYVDKCKTDNIFTETGKSYKETPGTSGRPGAVVITW